MKGVQCYELFGGIALKIHAFSFFIFNWSSGYNVDFGYKKVDGSNPSINMFSP